MPRTPERQALKSWQKHLFLQGLARFGPLTGFSLLIAPLAVQRNFSAIILGRSDAGHDIPRTSH
jgi:hypothetical protein